MCKSLTQYMQYNINSQAGTEVMAQFIIVPFYYIISPDPLSK